MEALKCPVCEGKQTVPDGFYGEWHENTDRIECRSCSGKGYVVVPEGLQPPPQYVPMPYPVYPWPTWPQWPGFTTTTGTPLITWQAETTTGPTSVFVQVQ